MPDQGHPTDPDQGQHVEPDQDRDQDRASGTDRKQEQDWNQEQGQGHSVASRVPAALRRPRGRHRLQRTGTFAHITATALAAGVAVAVGQPLLNATAAAYASPEVLRASAGTSAVAEEDTDTGAYAALVMPQARPVPAAAEAEKLRHTVEAQERLRQQVERAQAAEQQRIAEEAERKRLAAAAAERRKQEEAAAATAATAAAEAKKAAGWVRPAVGRFTSGFGSRWGTTHYGVDIANAIGTPIVSAAAGTVIEAGPASGFGLWVRVRHDDGTVTVYGHVNEILRAEGTRVAAGEQIATIGNRGQSTGPHLHFEVWVDGGRKVDPLPWMAARGVTLS